MKYFIDTEFLEGTQNKTFLMLLLEKINAENIILSYSSGSRVQKQNILDFIQKIGKLENIVEINYQKNVMASMSTTKKYIDTVNENNKEFLFLIKK